MKKLHKILIMTVLAAMLVSFGAVASSAAATMTPSQTFAYAAGDESITASSGSQKCAVASVTKSENKYYSISFIDSGANANIGSGGNKDFLGKGDYIVTEYDFMAEDWTTVKSILIGWNSRDNSGGALNDFHLNFSNTNGAPTIQGGPFNGSITLDARGGVWHHLTMVVKIGGEHATKKAGVLTAVKGQDAVEAYVYVDGQCFAYNLIGDGKEFWSTNTTYFQTLRLTASGANQQLNIDNVRVAQYEETRELRDFFRYREKNGGAFPDLHAVDYTFLDYNKDYDYPLGTPNCKVVELNGTETLFDRFEKAVKFASPISGARLVLLADIGDVVVSYPVTLDRAGFDINYTVSPSLRASEQVFVNPITGEISNEVSFIKRTKYAYYRWYVDHLAETLDSRGYTPLVPGEAVVYDGYELPQNIYVEEDGLLYTFTGKWLLDGEVLETVPAYATNSYYTLTPVFEEGVVYAIVEAPDGSLTYALSTQEVAEVIASAAKDSIVTFVRDVSVTAPLKVQSRIVFDLAGKKLIASEANSAIVLTAAASGTVICSSAEGASITSGGAVIDTACAFTFEGEDIVANAASLLKASAAVRGVAILGGVFYLDGDTVLSIAADASLGIEIDATLVAADQMLLADPLSSYSVTLGGALCDIVIPGSAVSEVVLSENLVLTHASAFVGDALPDGAYLANSSLVIASKKGEMYGKAVYYVVTDAAQAVLLHWLEGVSEYYVVGEEASYDYSDYYDAKKFYTPNGIYSFESEAGSVIGTAVLEEWVGLALNVKPLYDSTEFYLVAVKPDGTYVPYTSATNLTSLMESGEYEAGTRFAIGKKVISIENLEISCDYEIDLNGYTLPVFGLNRISGASLKIYSSVQGAVLYSDSPIAFLAQDGALEIVGEKLAYYGNTLAYLDATSALKIEDGVFVVDGGAPLYDAVAGATVVIEGISANAQLFDAAEGYEWKAVEETVTIGGAACSIVAKYEKIAQ